MLIKKGIAVSPGVAIAQALVIDAEDQPVRRRTVAAAQVGAELARLDKALALGVKDLDLLREQTSAQLGPEMSRIFGFHLDYLQDAHFVGQIHHMIEDERVTADYAVYSVMRRLAQTFLQQEDRLFRDRADDIWDMERRILRHLIGDTKAALGQVKHEVIVVAHDLTPSQTASFDKAWVHGLATDAGGQTSHTAILARAMGIPTVVALEDITKDVSSGDTIIIDGHNGVVVVNPDADQLLEYKQSLARFEARGTSLDKLAKLPAVTADGVEIELLANIEFPNEIEAALNRGAVGVGLYRTEFLFLSTPEPPTEEQQFAAYREALAQLKGRPLTIRTLDLGADKWFHGRSEDHPDTIEHNPFLGCRSVRLCLQDLPLFKTQLRAILRASVDQPVKIMFPMISSVRELRQCKMVLSDVMEDLDEQGVEFSRKNSLGVMIEVPSAALQAKTLAREVDFFSIGTNDLIQYTVAVDRGNERVASLYSGAHPAVIMLIKEIVRAGHRARIDVSLCGEMGSDPAFVPLLLGMGLRTLSVAPPSIPEIKRVLRSITIPQCQRIARKVSAYETDREVINYLADQMQKILPELYEGRSFEA